MYRLYDKDRYVASFELTRRTRECSHAAWRA